MTEPCNRDSHRPDDSRPDDTRLDDALAEFADRVLRASAPGHPPAAGLPPPDSPDADLRRLQQTVLRLHDAIDPSLPDPALKHRIHQQLQQEWNTRPGADALAAGKGPVPPALIRRLGRIFTPAGRPALAYALVCLLVLLLAGVLVLLPPASAPMSGAAGGAGRTGWVLLGAGLLAAALALAWIVRRRP